MFPKVFKSIALGQVQKQFEVNFHILILFGLVFFQTTKKKRGCNYLWPLFSNHICCCPSRMHKQRGFDRIFTLGWKCPSIFGSTWHIPRYGPTYATLLCKFKSQHLPYRSTIWSQIQCRNLQTGTYIIYKNMKLFQPRWEVCKVGVVLGSSNYRCN